MSYISEIFDRANIQHIREFLLHGVECMGINDKSYKQRIKESGETTFAMIKTKFTDMNEQEKITNEVNGYVSAIENVYMEIGLQCGAALANQLLGILEKE